WLYARYMEQLQKLDIVKVYDASGGPARAPKEEECHFVPIPLQAFHQFLESIGSDLATIISACEKEGWIRYAQGGFDPRRMSRFYHILPAILIPWQDVNKESQPVPAQGRYH